MARNWLLAHWKRIAMQASLVGLLFATFGVAGFVVHAKRLALRLPLVPANQFGRLGTQLPRGWSTPVTSQRNEAGDFIQTEEILPEPLTGRKLSVRRLPAAGLMPPLDFLVRAGLLTPRDLTGREQGSREKIGPVARVQPLEVAHWPGVMVSHTALHPSGRRSLKEILACAVLPRGQAVIIKLDGIGPPDAADEELVRQIAETTEVFNPLVGDKWTVLKPDPPGTLVELGHGVFAAIPEHFTTTPADDRISRDLISDGADGHWTSIELIPCVWLADDPREQFLTMLAAREPNWHSATTKPVGDTAWQADRVPLPGELQFPARAYCITDGHDQAMIAILRGGWRDDSAFDAAWAGVSSNVRFTQHRDVPAMLDRGTSTVAEITETGLGTLLADKSVSQNWVQWNAAENSDRQDWMTLKVSRVETDAGTWKGERTPSLTGAAPLGIGTSGDAIYQSWSGSADFTTYSVRTDRAVAVRGETNARSATQRFDLRDGKLFDQLSGQEPRPVPVQYVPGGWLPMTLSRVADKPLILRTESFLACDGSAPPGLLTLVVSRTPTDPPNCITVTVNGSGRVAKFWYDPAGLLNQIDLGEGVRTQGIDAGQ